MIGNWRRREWSQGDSRDKRGHCRFSEGDFCWVEGSDSGDSP